MYLQKDGLKIIEDNGDYVVDFKFLVNCRQNSLPKELNEPIFVSGDYWSIQLMNVSSTSISYSYSMELTHSDLTKTFKGIWSVTLLGLDKKDNVSCSQKTLNKKINLRCRDRNLYSIALNLILTFEVKIVLFPSIEDNLKEVKADSVLSDLQRNYEDIARASDIMIIARDTNSENIPVHKAILTLRSSVFKAMFDNNMTESSSNQIHIRDFDAVIIKRMVEFLYKDTFTNIDGTSYEDFVSLLAIANKYEINSLKVASSRYLSKMITLDNIADMRNKAILYDSPTLLNNCLQFIELNSTKLFKNDSFLSNCNTTTL